MYVCTKNVYMSLKKRLVARKDGKRRIEATNK